MLFVARAAALDDGVHQLRQRAEFEGELQVARRLLGHQLECCGELLEVAAEDGAQHDVECQLAHFLGDVERLAARGKSVPARSELLIHRRECLREFGHQAAVEERLHHVSLPAPQLPLAGHESLAQQNLHAVEAGALGIIAVIGHQHPLDVIRMVNDVGVRLASRCKHPVGVAVTGEQLRHALQGIVRGADIELELGLGRLF